MPIQIPLGSYAYRSYVTRDHLTRRQPCHSPLLSAAGYFACDNDPALYAPKADNVAMQLGKVQHAASAVHEHGPGAG